MSGYVLVITVANGCSACDNYKRVFDATLRDRASKLDVKVITKVATTIKSGVVMPPETTPDFAKFHQLPKWYPYFMVIPYGNYVDLERGVVGYGSVIPSISVYGGTISDSGVVQTVNTINYESILNWFTSKVSVTNAATRPHVDSQGNATIRGTCSATRVIPFRK